MSTSANAPISLFDTLTGQKRSLELLTPGVCGIYCCGPTVYDVSHIGHARAALAPDLLVRALRHHKIDVKYVRNITDVEDKIIARAQREGCDPLDVSERFAKLYQEELGMLGMLTPDVQPKVSEHIPEILQIISDLIAKEMAYAIDGDVYYRVRSFSEYGKLSKRKLDDMQAGARVEVDARKEDPQDFALWKAAKPGEPSWESPWGPGRPGWHIECSAMSCKHLGETFDIHTGGRDLIFPHHENEIAQSQGAYGTDTFAKHWLHNGFVNFAGEKMSKSLGNFFTIREVLALYPAEVLRYYLLSVHYRSPINFDIEAPCPKCGALLSESEQQSGTCSQCNHVASVEELKQAVRFPGLEEADDRVAYVYETIAAATELVAQSGSETPAPANVPDLVSGLCQRVATWMSDDLNSAAALSELSDPLGEVNRLLGAKKGIDKAQRLELLQTFLAQVAGVSRLLGSFENEPTAYLAARRDLKARRIRLDIAHVDALVAQRTQARADKNWQRSDEIRDELAKLNVKIKDGSDGTTWTI